MYFVHTKEIPKARLEEWIRLELHKRELATRLTAHLHGLGVVLFRKRLTEARHEYPGYAKLWEHGYDYTNELLHKMPTLVELETMKQEIETIREQKSGQIDEMNSWLYGCVLEAIQQQNK